MLRNYYTLYHLTKEFQKLVGSVVYECFTQERDVLVLQTDNGERQFCLQFSTDARFGSIFLRKPFVRAKSNSTDLFHKIIGRKILRVTQSEKQRIVHFEFSEFNLFFVLFGGSKNNAFLTDNNNVIVDSFKSAKKHTGTHFAIDSKIHIERKDRNVFDFVSKEQFLGNHYAKFLLSEIEFEPTRLYKELTETEKNILEATLNNFTAKLLSAKGFYIYFINDEYLLSLIKLNEGYPIQILNSISETAFSVYVKSIKLRSLRKRFEKAKKIITSKLTHLKNMQQSLLQSKTGIVNRHRYKLFGDILVSQPNTKQKGLSKLTVSNFDFNPIEIPLKPEWTLLENSQFYYEKAKKVQKHSHISPLKELEIKDSICKYESLLNELLLIPSILNFEEFEMKHKDLFDEFNATDESQPTSKFRRFDLGEGFYLYVGRNARNNDELTFGFAKPNDYWFHARSVGGSHCVLRVNRGQVPPKYIIEKAGQIAGYFSKARNSKYIPVAYTQRKYIHKPKRASAGTVTMNREEVIMVEPKIPNESESTSTS